MARAGIQSAAAIFRNQTVELIRNDIVGSLEAQLVDMHLDAGAFGLVLGLAQQVVLRRDAVEPRLFLLVVNSTHAVGTLEHNMLKIVGYTCVRTVLCSCLDNDGTKDLWLRVVFVQPDGHTVT